MSGSDGVKGSDARSGFSRREGVRPGVPVWVLQYLRIACRGFDVNYIRLERGTKPEHEHASVQISVTLSRQPLVAVERKSFGLISRQPLLFGGVCVIPSWQRHTVTWDARTEWVSFHLDPRFVARAAGEFGVESSIGFVPAFCRPDGRISQLGCALGAALRDDGDEPPRLYIESLAGALVEHLLNFYAAGKKSVRPLKGGITPAKLRRVAEFVDAHLDRDLTTEELAATVGLSQFHFARAFKKSTGLAPHQYVTKQRIERARILMKNTALPIAHIALSTGFNNQSHFGQVFRRLVGASPAAYRAATT